MDLLKKESITDNKKDDNSTVINNPNIVENADTDSRNSNQPEESNGDNQESIINDV